MASLPAWGQPLVAAAESVEASAVVQASVALAAAPVVPVGAAVGEGAAAERPAPVSALVLEWTLFLKTRKALSSPPPYLSEVVAEINSHRAVFHCLGDFWIGLLCGLLRWGGS